MKLSHNILLASYRTGNSNAKHHSNLFFSNKIRLSTVIMLTRIKVAVEVDGLNLPNKLLFMYL